MTDAAAAIAAVIASGRGERPASLHNEEAERVLSVALALLVELSVACDRIDRLEREVADLRGVPVQQWREEPPLADIIESRQAATEALHLRALRIFLDPRAA